MLALAASAVWLGSQHASISRLDEKIRVVSERVDLYETIPESERRSSGPVEKVDPLARFLLENGDFDWAAIGKVIASGEQGGMPEDIAAFLKLRRTILAMSVSEIEDALGQVEKEKLSNKVKESLESMLAGIFVQKDPAAALAHFKDRLGESVSILTMQLGTAFEKWLKQDPAAAIAWFDARQRAGSFETKALNPKGGLKQQFEMRLIGQLMKDDLVMTRERLEKLPNQQKIEVLKGAIYFNEGEGLSENYLTLLRETLPEKDRYESLAGAFGQQVFRSGLPPLREQIAHVRLEAAEKEAIIGSIVEHYARPWGREPAELIEVYSWADREVPGQAAELTGRSFAHFAGHRNIDLEKTLREVIQLAERQNDPAILEHFGSFMENPESHLGRIKEPDLRASYLDLVGISEQGTDQ